MARNREKTSTKILEEAANRLLESGFSGWGINAVARAAKVDKVLIYRYFGSLTGLLEELVRTTRFWPDPDTIDADSGEAFIAGTIRSLETYPLWKLLIALPREDPCWLRVQQQSASELDTWLNGLRRKSSGNISDTALLRLPALIQFNLLNRQSTLSPREIWASVSPPLEWINPNTFQAFEDLPTELL